MTPTPKLAEALASVIRSTEWVSPEDCAARAISDPDVIEAMRAMFAPEPSAEAMREAESLVTAWLGAFESIEAHLMDCVAMRDEANPERYLSILRSSVKNLPRDSQQIAAARWADYARHASELARLQAENAMWAALIAETERIASQGADNGSDQ